MQQLLAWWLAVQVLAALFFPVTAKLCRNLPDRGYSLAKSLGLLLPAYVFWLLSSFGLIDNLRGSILLVILAAGGCAWLRFPEEGKTFLALWNRSRTTLIVTEVLFAAALAGWAFVRALDPQIVATEKPMEYAFLNGVLRSDRFPPADPWMSGYSISYYYFGYVIVGMLSRVIGVASAISFNLGIALLFALTMIGAFGVAYNLASAAADGRRDEDTQSSLPFRKGADVASSRVLGPIWCGLLGALFVAIVGNLEGILEIVYARAWLPLSFWRWVGIQNLDQPHLSPQWYPSDWMWWFRASRVISDFDPATRIARDYTINEFPFFSFFLGDLHPHLLALPFTFLVLALALNLVLSTSEPSLDSMLKKRWELAGLGIVVGGLGFLNSWDMPTYAVVLAGSFALKKCLSSSGFRWSIAREAALFLALLIAAGVALYLPFYLGFHSQASGIGIVLVRSKMHQFLIFWAPFLFLGAAFIIAHMARPGLRPASPQADGATRRYTRGGWFNRTLLMVASLIVVLVALQASVMALMLAFVMACKSALGVIIADENGRGGPRRVVTAFVLLLIVLAALLLFATETVFVRDFFGNRMNTVFKVYYQAWVLLAIAGAYVVYYFSTSLRAHRMSRPLAVAAYAGCAVGAVLLVGTIAYPTAAVSTRITGFEGKLQLDGTAYQARAMRDDYDAMKWLEGNVRGSAVILEAPGGSYSEFGRVSGSTGLPTVLGWDGHELQWRGSGDEAARRKADVDAIYRTTDGRAALDLLRKYGVDYVFVGMLERRKYDGDSTAWLNKFSDIGDVVYQNPGAAIFKIRTGKRG